MCFYEIERGVRESKVVNSDETIEVQRLVPRRKGLKKLGPLIDNSLIGIWSNCLNENLKYHDGFHGDCNGDSHTPIFANVLQMHQII